LQVAFFLLPKSETVYLQEHNTLRQALEKMQHHAYTSVPLLDKEGHYVGSITTADFLWFIKDNYNVRHEAIYKMLVRDIPRQHYNDPVRIDAQIEDLLRIAMEQNFIPVTDDLGVFIGIVRRREIMDFYINKYNLTL